MKLLKLKIAIVAIVSSSVSAMASDIPPSGSDISATASNADLVLLGETIANRNCVMCHGPSFQGYFVAPRLAGQRPQYIVNQIHNFVAHTRDNPYSQLYMWRASAKLEWTDPAGPQAVAAYLSTLEPKAANDGHEEFIGAGQSLYAAGQQEENVPACAACHGPNAVGSRNIPRLGGLSYFYLKRRLEQWAEGYHTSGAYPMPKVARNLSPDQIEALASYLSFIDYTREAFK
jgi:cytochrome c553